MPIDSNEPLFLSVEQVDEIHDEQITLFGGTAGIRDPAALDAAVHMAQQSFGGQYVHIDVFEMAAAYLVHLCMGHPYVDANKRTAAEAADVFLAINGYELSASEEQYEELIIGVIEHRADKHEVAAFFRLHSVQV